MGAREERGRARRGGAGCEQREGGRPVLYCVIPADLAPRLHDALRRHFADDPEVTVLVERRSTERRSAADRRTESRDPGIPERRRLRSPSGRRIADRRATTVPSPAPELPRKARRYAERLHFFQRVEPSTEERADRDSARMVLAFQAGDRTALQVLYERYFDLVYGYLRTATGERALAEDLTQDVFETVVKRLARFEVRGPAAFRSWLLTIARNMALDAMSERQRLSATEPSTLEDLREAGAAHVVAGRMQNGEDEEPRASEALDWISDRDVAILIQHLPEAQRQVIVMRFLLGLPARDIAHRLGRSEEAVRQLQSRALRGIRKRLSPARRSGDQRAPSRKRIGPLPVLGARRFVISHSGRPPGGPQRGCPRLRPGIGAR